MKHFLAKRVIVATLLISFQGILFTSVAPVWATDFTVTKTADTADGTCDADCSLREAITAANAAGAGDHTVILGSSTYTLGIVTTDEDANADGDLDITNTTGTITIQGDGSTVIDGESGTVGDRVFDVHTSADLTLEDLTVQDGDLLGNGGLILTESDLSLDGVTLADGTSAGNGGLLRVMGSGAPTVTITDSELGTGTAPNGGGIYVSTNPQSTLTISGSTFVGNAATQRGGALYTSSLVETTITNSVIQGNSATFDGAGLYNDSSVGNNTTITNSTFFDNLAGDDGGAIYLSTSGGDIDLEHVTIAQNESDNDASGAGDGGGIMLTGGTVTSSHSIIANNLNNGSAEDCFESSGTYASGGYNITTDAGSACGMILGTDQELTDPGLAVGLSGSFPQYVEFTDAASSPAVNTIPTAACEAVLGGSPQDQASNSRPGYCDVGAFEYQDSTVPAITITNDTAPFNTIECSETYSDAGATASDDIDGDITGSISTDTSAVNEAVPGDYSVAYDVDDLSLNSATTATRTVTVKDTIAPVITRGGQASVSHEAATTYTDSGATVTDACDTEVNLVTSGDTVNETTLGEYVIEYDATDADGNSASQVTRTVTVEDTTAPVVTVVGETSVELIRGDVYEDAGATASDSLDGDLTPEIQTAGGVDTLTVGDYTVTYTVSDSSGNTTVAERIVSVLPLTSNPVVSLQKSAGDLVIEYANGDNETTAPYSGKKKFRYELVGDQSRIATFDGRVLKVFGNGVLLAKKTLHAKKASQRNAFRLHVDNLYTDKNYYTVVTARRSGSAVKINVLRLTAGHKLKKRTERSIQPNQPRLRAIKSSADDRSITVRTGFKQQTENRTWRVTKRGRLKRL